MGPGQALGLRPGWARSGPGQAGPHRTEGLKNPIWLDFMRPNIDFLPRNKNLPPNGIVSIKVDKKTGLKLESDSGNSIFEYYLEEYLPE